VRREGVSSADVGNTRLDIILELASRYIDTFTGQWFEPRQASYVMDGRGHRTIYFEVPVIEVTSIKEVDAQGNEKQTFDPAGYLVYNRHVRLNQQDPDDRENSKVERVNPTDPWDVRLYGQAWWPRGQQNVQVDGWFGYTDYDSTDPHGQTPPLIERACVLLALRECWERWGQEGESEEARFRSRLKSEKTRDQSYQLGGVATSLADALAGGRLTGDPEIDSILIEFRKSVGVATV